MNNLRERLKFLKERDNLTQYELSIRSGVNIATLSRLFSGKINRPNIENIDLLANYFRVTRDWLLSGIENYNQNNPDQTIDEPIINNNYKHKTTTEMKHLSNEERIDRLLDQNDKLITMLQTQVNTINNLSIKVKEERSMGEARGRKAI